MIRPLFILTLLLLIAFVPTRSGLGEVFYTTGTVFTLYWMHLRIEQNENLARKTYAQVSGKLEEDVKKTFEPKGLGETSIQLIEDVKPYIEPVVKGLKKILEDRNGKEIDLKRSLNTIIEPSDSSKSNEK